MRWLDTKPPGFSLQGVTSKCDSPRPLGSPLLRRWPLYDSYVVFYRDSHAKLSSIQCKLSCSSNTPQDSSVFPKPLSTASSGTRLPVAISLWPTFCYLAYIQKGEDVCPRYTQSYSPADRPTAGIQCSLRLKQGGNRPHHSRSSKDDCPELLSLS